MKSADLSRILRGRDTGEGTRYRLESRPQEGYSPATKRGMGADGWTRREEFGTFSSLDDASEVAFAATNDGRGQVFAVVPIDKYSLWLLRQGEEACIEPAGEEDTREKADAAAERLFDATPDAHAVMVYNHQTQNVDACYHTGSKGTIRHLITAMNWRPL